MALQTPAAAKAGTGVVLIKICLTGLASSRRSRVRAPEVLSFT
jgi:hypothetical protein